jgi:predicted component of type VI protein secretion system
MSFRLRHQQHHFELAEGEFLIGRSAECQLALDDALVSRRHALLTVTANAVVVKDLGSRNGVVVNGTKIDSSRVLLDGDKLTIGSQEMHLISSQPLRSNEGLRARSRTGAQTLAHATPALGVPAAAARSAVSMPKDPPKRVDSFPLLATLSDKALALGRTDDAERLLASVMAEILKNVQQGDRASLDTVDQAALYAVRLAGATAKGSWVDYVIALYTAAHRPCPAPIVDELHVVLRKTSAADIPAFRAYLEMLRDQVATFGPGERFLVQRIEGLERLAALR